MTTNTSETTGQSLLDWVKWLVVVALIGGGIFANWYYQDQSLLNRVLALVAMAVVAVGVALQTEKGRGIWSLLKESRTEIRRVVWPTRQETTQTTLVVVALVLVFSLILWGLDSLLSWLVSSVIG
ncbi:MAG: preprotein translocase subunit SecE [Gammaproteobacteria bacterium]|nr:preprotein translocase subunit SecE [Gammaproteobacteria bacterium]